VALGQVIGPILVDCDGQPDWLGSAEQTQLITFATAKDCSSCETHMSGLNDLRGKDSLPVKDMVVLWAEPGTASSELARARAHSNRRVCSDVRGEAWDHYNLQHTPVTLVLQHGRILYLHDGPLISTEDRTQFVSDLHRYAGLEWPHAEAVAPSATKARQ
jgi:hypothetical protein